MIDNLSHSDDELPENLRNLSKQQEEFKTPVDYFAEMESSVVLKLKTGNTIKEFDLPENYFEDSEQRILAALDATMGDSDDFFEHQYSEILLRAKLSTSPAEMEFAVPEGYFAQQSEVIAEKTRMLPVARVLSIKHKFWAYAAAAACVATALVVLWPYGKKTVQPSFAELMVIADVEIEDMEFFAGEEDFYDMYYHLTEEMTTDTLIEDSTSTNVQLQVNPASDLQRTPVKLDPRTGLPMKKNQNDIKPNDRNGIPNWDDITREDLFEYLMEEGDDDLLEDL